VATNKELTRLVDEKTFREDLYYRINVLNLNIPPLRERKEDIPLLINFFIKKHKNRVNKIVKGVSQGGMKILQDYDWPGNIRQLENIVERLMVRTKEGYIMASLVKKVMQSLRGYTVSPMEQSPEIEESSSQNVFSVPLDKSLAEIEKMIIRKVVQEEQGNKIAAAERLHIGRTTLWRKLKE
jgi:transcriptional regulator with PAS, ATPase and Fis domain